MLESILEWNTQHWHQSGTKKGKFSNKNKCQMWLTEIKKDRKKIKEDFVDVIDKLFFSFVLITCSSYLPLKKFFFDVVCCSFINKLTKLLIIVWLPLQKLIFVSSKNWILSQSWWKLWNVMSLVDIIFYYYHELEPLKWDLV